MNIVLLGIQGSGKGTLVQDLSKHLDFSLVSVGALLREEIATGSELGKLIKSKTDKGELVDIKIVIETVKRKLSQNRKPIVIFDGFPRSSEQADELDKICNVDLAIYLNLKKEDAMKRIMNRLTCSKCGNITTRVKCPDLICPVCKGKLTVRSDDSPEAVNKRFEQYELETYPLIERYKKHGVLVAEIDASKTPDEVLKAVMKVIK